MIDIALDSSVLISIANISPAPIGHQRKKYDKILLNLQKMITTGEINVIVTQTVYREIKRGKEHDNGQTQKFVNRFCEVLNPTQYAQDKALCVTDAYGNKIINEKFAIYMAEDYTQKNYDDATIIAEISVEQKMRGKRIPFITANIRDVNDIASINKINVRHGLPKLPICSLSRHMDAYNFAKKEDTSYAKE